jgi:calcineurin-like phosphoesterase
MLVIHLMGTVFMNYSMENPFHKVEKILKEL